MRCIISGGRYFDDYDLAKSKLDVVFKNKKPDIIISGRCHVGKHTFTTDDGIKVYGADGLGERYAKENHIKVYPYPADFKNLGKKAGPLRNRQMGKAGTHAVVFHIGSGAGGSQDMIDVAKEFNLPTRVITYK